MQRTPFVPSGRIAAEPGYLSNPPWVRSHNVPAQLTLLVGREQEEAAVCALLRRSEVRLLTLTGTGGIGKTRLALQVATDLLDDFADGVCFIPLATINDPGLVVPTIAQALGSTEPADQALFDQLKEYLRDKHLLLLLDNFEQLIAAAPRLSELLVTCPELKILVTSRAVLRVRGEYEFPVSPLALPDLNRLSELASLSQYAAVELFIQRAQAVKPDFELTPTNARAIAEVCAHLDGLPLAIELAAARIKLLSPQALLTWPGNQLQILTRGARDAPLRQQTLRNTIRWSYDLLDAAEQQLFRRLSVFVGGCTLEAAEVVGTALGDLTTHVLDGVASLIDKSLLQQTQPESEEPRVAMLETIREYGLECLTMSGEIELIRRAHAEYFLALAQQAEPLLDGPQQAAWLERLEQEHEDLRAALRWLEEQREVETASRLAGALWRFWWMHGYWTEGRDFLERALARSAGIAASVRAKALNAAGMLAFFQGDFSMAAARCEESLRLSRELGDTRGSATSLYRLGQIAWMRSSFEAAHSLGEETLALCKEMDDTQGMADALILLGYICMDQGEYVRARSLIEESLALFKEVNNKGGIVASLVTLARMSFFQDDLATAYILAQKFLLPPREMGGAWSMVHSLATLAHMAFLQGEHARADSRGEEALVLFKGGIVASLVTLARVNFFQDDLVTAYILAQKFLLPSREIGDRWSIAYSFGILAYVAFLQGEHDRARSLGEEALVLFKELGNRQGMALALYGLVWVACGRGDYVTAQAQFEESMAIAIELGDQDFMALFPEGLAAVVAAQGQPGWAVQLLGAAEAFREVTSVPLPSIARSSHEQMVAAVRAQLSEEIFARAWSEGQTMTPGQAIAAQRLSTIPAETIPAIIQPALTYPAGLTAREVEVLRLVALGLTNIAIAEKLIISPRTVSTHLSSIFNKLEVTTRSSATRFAADHHLLNQER